MRDLTDPLDLGLLPWLQTRVPWEFGKVDSWALVQTYGISLKFSCVFPGSFQAWESRSRSPSSLVKRLQEIRCLAPGET